MNFYVQKGENMAFAIPLAPSRSIRVKSLFKICTRIVTDLKLHVYHVTSLYKSFTVHVHSVYNPYTYFVPGCTVTQLYIPFRRTRLYADCTRIVRLPSQDVSLMVPGTVRGKKGAMLMDPKRKYEARTYHFDDDVF